MPQKKYEHLLKPLSMGRIEMPEILNADESRTSSFMGPGNADKIVWLNGRDHLEGLDLNFSWGFYSGLGDWHTGQDPHVHPYAECLVFVGLDSAKLNYLGAEIEVSLGKEQETYTFDEPVVVIIPAGLPHCPLITKRVFSPKGYGFFLLCLGAEPNTTWMGEGVDEESLKIMADLAEKQGLKLPMKSSVSKKRYKKNPVSPTGKYDHLVRPLSSGLFIERSDIRETLSASGSHYYNEMKARGEIPGPGYADHLTWMFGKDLGDLNMNFNWGFYSSPGIWHRGIGARRNTAPEIQVIAGLDPGNIDYLGAQIEIELGEEHERYIIDKPTAVIRPAGMPYNPIVTRWVDRPFASYTIGLTGNPGPAALD
ncbi:MAG: hypothetical protein JXL81_09835 [Deltaproteobacteria bacterium]|nr:hypothetical protein [Deltaproteobacteria bacterium]